MSAKKVVVVLCCFILTSMFVYLSPSSKASLKKSALKDALLNIQGWGQARPVALEDGIFKALELDDYVNQGYTSDKGSVFLYIGYYLTTKKVGAAHDPLVCFPGQGWLVSDKQGGKLTLDSGFRSDPISYSTMIVSRGNEKQLIVYWFQSYDQASADTFSQKLQSLSKKLLGKGEDNAFVRVSINIGNRPVAECREIILNFVKCFYPNLLEYIRS